MPFSNYNVPPEHIEAMRSTFRRTCEVLRLDCGKDDAMTEIVVTKIMKCWNDGDRDPVQISDRVLAELESSNPQ
jgi:hypothetical protein